MKRERGQRTLGFVCADGKPPKKAVESGPPEEDIDKYVQHVAGFLSAEAAQQLYDETIAVMLPLATSDEIRGQPSKRKVALLGPPNYTYQYIANTRATVMPMVDERAPLFADMLLRLNALLGCGFNTCIMNYYPDGSSGISYHSDAEREMVPGTPIASVSLGAARTFAFRRKGETFQCAKYLLEPGTLVVMRPGCQERFEHCITTTKSPVGPRINFTLRVFHYQKTQ